MKQLLFYITIMLSFTAMPSCMSELPEGYPNTGGDKDLLSIRVSMPQSQGEDNSRVAYDDASLGLTWETTDKLCLVGYDANGTLKGVSIFSLAGDVGTDETIFQGTAVQGATQYDIYYHPNNAINPSTGQPEPINYNNQVQTGDNNTDHLKKLILLKSVKRIDAELLKLETEDIMLMMQNCIIKFDFKNIPKEIGEPTSITWDVTEDRLGWWNSFKAVLGLKNIPYQATLTAYLCFAPMSIPANSFINVTLDGKKGNKSVIKMIGGKTYEANKRYTGTIDASANDPRYTIHYSGDVAFTKEMFDPQPESAIYDAEKKIGYIDYRKTFIDELGNLIIGFSKDITLITGAFKNRTDINTVILPEGITIIAEGAFSGSSLQDLTIPKSTTDLKANAFSNCTMLNRIHLQSSKAPSISGNKDKDNPLGLNLSNNLEIIVPSNSGKDYKRNRDWKCYSEYIKEE